MAKPNLSLDRYVILDLFPLIAFMIFICILLMSYIVGLLCCVTCNHIDTAVSSAKLLFKSFTKLAMVVFGPPAGVLNYRAHEEEEVDHMDNTVVYIHKRNVPQKIVTMLGSYVVTFIMFSVMVFWDIFLLKESSDCDDTTIDCFAQVADNDSSSLPVEDCTIYEGYGSNVTISCYEFVYSFGPALAAIGGLFTMIKIVMKVISAVFLGLYGYAIRNNKLCLFKFMILFQVLLVFLIPIALPIALIIFVVGLPSLSIANIVQIVLLMLTLAIGFSVPWGYFVIPPDAYELRQEENDRSPINPAPQKYGAAQQNSEE